MLDEKGRLFSGITQSNFGSIPEYFTSIDLTSQYGSFSTSIHDKKYQIIYFRMSRTNWLIVKTIPMEIYQKPMMHITLSMIFIGLISLFFISLFYIMVIFRYTKPIESLVKTMKMTGKGNLLLRAKEGTGIYETNELSSTFNRMLDDINELMRRNQIIHEEKVKMEMRSLQNQINPHFLYNTINAIRWMATLGGNNGVATSLITLVNLLRPVFNNQELMWSLDKELEFLTNYHSLMQMRYGKDVLLHTEYNNLSPMNICIPRFTLQPFVENCFEHALLGHSKLQITITLKQFDNKLCIIGADDGTGIDSFKLKKLNESIFSQKETQDFTSSFENTSHTGIGIVNCYQRLRLSFGTNITFTITSLPKKGTTITFELPIGKIDV